MTKDFYDKRVSYTLTPVNTILILENNRTVWFVLVLWHISYCLAQREP